jgi:hypothetical protein
MENWIITSRQTFKEKLDNPHQRFKFHSSLIFGFTGVSIPYFEPIFSTFIYLSTLLDKDSTTQTRIAVIHYLKFQKLPVLL